MKQHYVPEVYLKNFSFDELGNLFTLRLFPLHFKRQIKSINKSAVCYEKDMLTFQTDSILRINNYESYLELENLFNTYYENSEIKDLTEEIQKENTLNGKQLELLTEIVLSIRFRNIEFRNRALDIEVKSLLKESQLAVFQENLDQIIKLQDEELVKEYKEKFNEEFLSRFENEEHLLDLYRNFLIRMLNNLSEEFNRIKTNFLKCDLHIYIADSQEFITSDNPGHQTDLNGNYIDDVGNESSIYTFPLTSKIVCVWLPTYLLTGNHIGKIKYTKNLTLNLIEKINVMTANACNEKIFGSKESILEVINEKIPVHRNR